MKLSSTIDWLLISLWLCFRSSETFAASGRSWRWRFTVAVKLTAVRSRWVCSRYLWGKKCVHSESWSLIGCRVIYINVLCWHYLSVSHLPICRTTWMCVRSLRFPVRWVNVKSEWWGKRFQITWAGNVNTERPAASSAWSRCLWLTYR